MQCYSTVKLAETEETFINKYHKPSDNNDEQRTK